MGRRPRSRVQPKVLIPSSVKSAASPNTSSVRLSGDSVACPRGADLRHSRPEGLLRASGIEAGRWRARRHEHTIVHRTCGDPRSPEISSASWLLDLRLTYEERVSPRPAAPAD